MCMCVHVCACACVCSCEKSSARTQHLAMAMADIIGCFRWDLSVAIMIIWALDSCLCAHTGNGSQSTGLMEEGLNSRGLFPLSLSVFLSL